MKIIKMFFTPLIVMLPFACRTMTTLERAAVKGAYANIDVLVVDEVGTPMENVQVDIRFGMIEEEKSVNTMVFTDKNGHAMTSGLTCGHYVRIKATYPEYYPSTKNLCFVAPGKEFEVKRRHWQPDVISCELRLREIKTPAKLVRNDFFLRFPSTNEWYGVDLFQRDWVAPNGKGETADVELFYSWKGETPHKRTEDNLTLRFPEKPNGGTKMPIVAESQHSYSYEASTNLLCTQLYTSRNTSYWNGHLTDNDSDLTFRIRSVTNSVGEITSCHYGRFRNIEYAMQRSRTAAVILSYDLNPTPMDNNLE